MMTSIDINDSRREWIDRLCRPIHIVTGAYGTGGGDDFDSLEQAEAVIAACICDCQSLLPEDGLQEGEDFEFVTMLMNPATGSVAPQAEWEQDYREMSEEEWGGPNFEDGHLIEVVPDGTGWWKEV